MAERRRRRTPAPLPPPMRTAVRQTQTRQQQVALWQHRIDRARRLRFDWAEQYHVDLLAQTFYGNYTDVLGSEESWPQMLNRFLPTMKAQLPGLLAQAPTFFVHPTGQRAGAVPPRQAASAAGLLDAIARQDEHFIQEAKLALQQSFWALGVLKALYLPRLEPNPRKGEPMVVVDADGEPLRDGVTGMVRPLLDPETQEPMVEPATYMDDQVYRWEWVHWGNMLLPDAGPAMLRWPWVAEEVEVLVSEARHDPRFPKSLRDQLQATARPRHAAASPDLAALFAGVHEDDQTLWYVEGWDMQAHRHIVLAEGQAFSRTQLLLDEPTPEGVEDHPYAILPGYTPITDPKPSPWPLPHVYNWLALHREYNLRREQLMNGAKRSARKVFYDDNTFPDADAAAAALQSAADMESVRLTDINRPPLVVTDPPLPANIERDFLMLTSDWNQQTGMPGERLASAQAETATQAVLLDRSATLREGEMKDAVQLWLTTAGKKMWQLVRSTLTLEKWVKIKDWTDAEVQDALRRQFGPEVAEALHTSPGLRQAMIARYGAERWSPVTRETMIYEADVGITPGSARARTPDQDRQQTLMFMKTLSEVGAVLPQLLTSRAFVGRLAELFELGDAVLVDELVAAVQQKIQSDQQAQAAKAPEAAGGQGRGVSQVSQAAATGQPTMASRLQTAMMNGGM